MLMHFSQRYAPCPNYAPLLVYYVWTFWSKYIRFYLDLDTFIILCRRLFLFLSNRLQTLAQSLGFGGGVFSFLRISSCSSGFIQDFLDH